MASHTTLDGFSHNNKKKLSASIIYERPCEKCPPAYHGYGNWAAWGEVIIGLFSTLLLSQRADNVKRLALDNKYLGAGFNETVGHLLPEALQHPSADVAFLSFCALAYSASSFISVRHGVDFCQSIIFVLAGASVIFISFITNSDSHLIILSHIPKAVFLSMVVSLASHRLWRVLSQS